MRRLVIAAAVLLAPAPAAADITESAVDGGCEVTAAYSVLFHREPRGEHWAWWVAQGDETLRMLDRMWHTTEGQTTIWTRDSLPHIAEAIDTTCAPRNWPEGWVDAGHGIPVPPILLKIRWCESRDDYQAANPTSSARGAYQYLRGSWEWYGYAERYGVPSADLATPAEQDAAAVDTWQRSGTTPWNASKGCWNVG
jgi:hypothetical protein